MVILYIIFIYILISYIYIGYLFLKYKEENDVIPIWLKWAPISMMLVIIWNSPKITDKIKNLICQ